MKTLTRHSPKGSLAGDAAAFYHALSHLVRVYQFRDRQRICYHDISVTQCYALSVLVRRGAMRLDALAKDLVLDKSTASRAVDGLEQKGYVRRDEDPDDGRAVSLQLTRRGRALHDRIERELIEEQAHLLSNLSPGVRAAATRLLHQAAEQAERRFTARRTGPDDECSV